MTGGIVILRYVVGPLAGYVRTSPQRPVHRLCAYDCDWVGEVDEYVVDGPTLADAEQRRHERLHHLGEKRQYRAIRRAEELVTDEDLRGAGLLP